jgi:CheY-like chemotaxis protein
MTAPAFQPRRILVVDDEPFVCDAVKMMLNFDGHTVETTGDPREALLLFEPGKYDLVITDYSMPAMKGDALAQAIKERAPSQPVVMITAYAEMLPKSLTGVDYVVAKPFLLENLREAIARSIPAGR